MNTFWPSIGGSDNNKIFWMHQWEQHGTCQNETPYVYFNNTIQLRKSHIDLDSVLKAKVKLCESAPRENFVMAITIKLGDVDPIFRCVDKNGNKLLSEIIICIDKSGKNVVPCNAELPHDNCGPLIKFPGHPE